MSQLLELAGISMKLPPWMVRLDHTLTTNERMLATELPDEGVLSIPGHIFVKEGVQRGGLALFVIGDGKSAVAHNCWERIGLSRDVVLRSAQQFHFPDMGIVIVHNVVDPLHAPESGRTLEQITYEMFAGVDAHPTISSVPLPYRTNNVLVAALRSGAIQLSITDAAKSDKFSVG